MVILLHHMQVDQLLLQLRVELAQVVHQVVYWAEAEDVQEWERDLLQDGGGALPVRPVWGEQRLEHHIVEVHELGPCAF